MCYGWQEVRGKLCLLLLFVGLTAFASNAHGANAPRMTVELAWRTADPVSDRLLPPVELALTAGKILEVRETSASPSLSIRKLPSGSWALGGARGGRVRARIEVLPEANLLAKLGGQTFTIPARSIAEGPQELGAPDSPVVLTIERVSWDIIETTTTGDGTAKPGSVVPVTVGLNLLSSDQTETNVRLVAELRTTAGEGQVWRQEWTGLVPTNAAPVSTNTFQVRMPALEGTYVLELKAAWDAPAESQRTAARRIFRRSKPVVPANTASRKMSIAVIGRDQGRGFTGPGVEVDSIDLSRPRAGRAITSGRSPSAGTLWAVPDNVFLEAGRRDRLMGLLASRPDPVQLPASDASGLAWSAIGTRISHPGRPHRLTLTVNSGDPESLAVGLLEPATQNRPEPRLALDACASGAPVVPGGPPTTFSWIVWPSSPEPILTLVNRSVTSSVQVGLVTLTELPDTQPIPLVETAGRSVGLRYADKAELDRFGVDAWSQARNLADYLVSCSFRSVILPDGLADRSARKGLDGQFVEDNLGPDRLEVILGTLGRRGLTAWIDVPFDGTLPGLPAPDSPESSARGLARLDRRGKVDGAAYHPFHPEVRAAMARKATEALVPRASNPALAGILVRLGPGATLLGGPDTGLDDSTFTQFVNETLDTTQAKGVPGLASGSPDRFSLRARFVDGAGRKAWLSWRSAQLAKVYQEIAESVRKSSPEAGLMIATPGVDDNTAGDEARRVDAAGQAASQAWLAVGLDLKLWPTGENAPIILRGVRPSASNLAHDLATSPELDAQVTTQTHRGLLLGLDAPKRRGLNLAAEPLAYGPLGDEPLGHSLAALDPSIVYLSASSSLGQEERLRRFTRVLSALPSESQPVSVATTKGLVSVRAGVSGKSTIVSLANDTPYPIRVDSILGAPGDATVEDIGRGFRLAPESTPKGPRVVLDLEPYGVSAIRVGSSEVHVEAVTPLPPEAVLAGMKAKYDDLSAVLTKLNRSSSDAKFGPKNPGFEPSAIQLATAAAPLGWNVAGNPSASLGIDPVRPHAGRGSLRLISPSLPASAASDPFPSPDGPTLTVTASIRSDRPETKARLWVEAETTGGRLTRQSDLVLNPEWSTFRVRASGLPAGPIDSVRVRLEMLNPGSLWLDDVSISGAELTDVERLNARRTLSSALQAYRERRYADFARLSGSHWAKRVDQVRPGTATESPTRTAGEPSDLPRGRVLR